MNRSCVSVNQLWNRVTRNVIESRTKVEHYFELYRIGRHHNSNSNRNRETHLSDTKQLSFVSESFEQIETKLIDKFSNDLNIRPKLVITFFGNFCPHSKRPERLIPSLRQYLAPDTQLLNVVSSAGLIGSFIDREPTDRRTLTTVVDNKAVISGNRESLVEPIETQSHVGNCAGISSVIFPKYPNVEIDVFDERNLISLEKLNSKNDLKCLIVLATTCAGKTSNHLKELKTINQLKEKYDNRIAIGGIIIDDINYFSNNLSTSRKKTRDFYGIAFSGANVRSCSLLFNTLTPEATQQKFQEFRQNLDFDPHLKACETIGFMFICTGRGVHTEGYPTSNVEASLFRKVFPGIKLFGVFGQGEYGHNYWPSITREKQLQLSQELQESDSNAHELWHFYTSVLVLINLPKK